jgi:7-cyano-7-deazaguanine synthase
MVNVAGLYKEHRTMKAIVLVSGGLDSCTALAWAHARFGQQILPISFAYGQRHSREIAAAERICEFYGLHIPRYINLSQAFVQIGGSSLTSGIRSDNPSTESVDRTEDASLPPTFVPGRNLIMLSVAAAIGYVEKAYTIVGGWNAVDYSGYPDCRPEFLKSLQHTCNLALGLPIQAKSYEVIQIEAPLVDMSKADIVALALHLSAPLHLTWSCYAGGTEPCGECDSCKIRAGGFAAHGIPDPALT